MNETMPDISFERSMNHNYMILSKCDFFGKQNDNNQNKDYRTRMLLENHIQGLLPVTHRQINGESRYYYEINSLQSLDRLYNKSEIRYDELKSLLMGCVNLFERLEEYLLDGTQIIIKPQLIYVDVEKIEPYFVCYPDYEGDVRLSFMEFIDELLTKIDHTDEHAVMLGYQVYRYTRNQNYVISEIGRIMNQVILNVVHQEAKQTAEINSCIHDDIVKNEEERPQPPVEQPNSYLYNESDEYDEDENEIICNKSEKNVGDLVGGIFCVFVSLCAGAIVLGARLLGTFKLTGNNELYLCGAFAMAFVAAVLFFSCYIKKRKQDKELYNPDNESQDYVERIDSNKALRVRFKNEDSSNNNNTNYSLQTKPNNRRHNPCADTVFLGDRVVEERVLCGRINGKEVNIPLDKLPMTVGKLANVADFVINDAAVSKMHARFEEHDGRVYICDLNSTNGTVKNGVILGINQSVELEPGDRLRFGKSCFTYC